MSKIFCGLHAAHVVISKYNKNGECRCLGCPGCACQSCTQYKDLLDEADRKNQLRLERCMDCLKQR